MTEWWLRKAVICHLSPIFCNYYFVYEGTPDVPTYTLRGERDLSNNSLLSVFPISTHTLRGERDKSGITAKLPNSLFQLTRSVGSVTRNILSCPPYIIISTHTLRGERDSMAMI